MKTWRPRKAWQSQSASLHVASSGLERSFEGFKIQAAGPVFGGRNPAGLAVNAPEGGFMALCATTLGHLILRT